MKRWSVGTLILCSLLTSGCQSTKNPYDPPKPLDQMNHDELCGYYGFFLSNPALSEQTRRVATGKMHDKGCSAASAPRT